MKAVKSDVSMQQLRMLLAVAFAYTMLEFQMDLKAMPSMTALSICFQTMGIPLLPALGMVVLLAMLALRALHANKWNATENSKQAGSQVISLGAQGTYAQDFTCRKIDFQEMLQMVEHLVSTFVSMATMKARGLVPSCTTCANLLLLCSTSNVFWHWKIFAQCQRPVHLWLIGLYACICAMQVVFNVGKYSVASSPGAESIAWYMRRSNVTARWAFAVLAVALLSLVFWALLGAKWLAITLEETPNCLPADIHPNGTFFLCCMAAALVLSPLCSIFVFSAWQFGGSLERGTASLEAIQDADMLERWGQPSPIFDTDLQGMSTDGIAALPSEVLGAGGKSSKICPICLASFAQGEKIRLLPGCQHCFHRPCVDLWLVRNRTCPICKLVVCDGFQSEQV